MKNYKTIFNTLPFPCLICKLEETEFIVIEVNQKYAEVIGKDTKDLTGKTLRKAFPDNLPDTDNSSHNIVQSSLEKVVSFKKTDVIKLIRYDLKDGKSGELEEKYWQIENIPVAEEEGGDNAYVLCVIKDMTAEVLEKKKNNELQARLLAKKEKHKHFIEKNTDGLYSFDLKGNFISVNQGLVEISETPEEELLKSSFLPFCAPHEVKRVQALFEKAVLGENQKFEADFITGKGRAIIMNISLVPMKYKGNITGIYGIGKDITALRHSENALEQSETKFKALVQEGSDVIVILNIDGDFNFVSETSIPVLGLDPADLLGKNAFDLIHPEDREEVFQAFLSLQTQKQVQVDSYRFKNGEGEWRWLESKATNMCSEPGVEGIVVNSRDITERINSQKALIESEERFRSIFENTLDAVLVSIPDGSILAANPAACKLFQRSEEEMCSIGRAGIVDKSDPRLKTALALREKTGKANVELSFVRKDGTKFIGDLTSSVFQDIDGNNRTSTIIRDITEKKELEENLRRSREKYKYLFTHNPLPNWIYDNETFQIIDVNEAAIIHYGYSRTEFLQLKITDIRQEEDISLFKEYLKKPQNDQNSRFGKSFHRKKDGSIIKVEINSYKLNFDERDCTLVVSHDITAREAIIQKLKDQEAKLSTAQKIARLGYWEQDFITGNLFWTAEVYKIWEVDNINFETNVDFFLETIHPDDITLFKQDMEAALSGLKNMDLEHRIILPDGKFKWVQCKGKLVLDELGVPIRFEGTVQDISDRVKAENLLKEINYRYELVTKATSDAIWDWQFNTGTLYWGDGFRTLFGHDCHSLPPNINSWEDNIHPEDAIGVIRNINRALESNEESWQAEYRFRKVDGSYALVVDKGFIIRDENKTAVRMVGAMQDITEKKQLEGLLEKATILSRIGSYEVDFKNDSMYWSSMTKEIHEVEEDFVPHSLNNDSFYEKFYKSHLLTAYKNSVKMGIPVDVEAEITTAKGKQRWVRILGEPTFEKGKCIKVSGSFQDIDKIKKAELEVLKASEEKLEILESIGDAFFALDQDLVVTYFNQRAEEVLNYPKENILGKKLVDVFALQNSAFEFYYLKALAKNETQHFEAFFDAHQAWYEVNAYPSTSGLSVYFRDITKRKKASLTLKELNRNLKKYTEELVTANKGLEQFSYIISHNLRSPVANIIGLAHLLEDQHYPETVKDQLRKELFESTRRLDNVIQDLNQILQVKNSFSDIKEPVNLHQLTSSIKYTLKDAVKKEQVTIFTDFSGIDEITTVSSYLHSIFYNLIFNSIKFRRLDLPPVIVIKSERTEDRVKLIFEDNGLGIDLEKKGEELFKLYKRFHHHVEGKGMGLFMVKTQTEMLGGKISVFSEINKGTTFVLEFKEDVVINLKSEENAALYSH